MPRYTQQSFPVNRSHARPLNRRIVLQGTLGVAGLALVGCSAPGIGQEEDPFLLVANPAKEEWPPMFREAPDYIQETYRFAIANKNDLQWMPCFCGCGETGHTSNFDCFVAEERANGEVVLDPMSFG
jgi:hypothetical protein